MRGSHASTGATSQRNGLSQRPSVPPIGSPPEEFRSFKHESSVSLAPTSWATAKRSKRLSTPTVIGRPESQHQRAFRMSWAGLECGNSVGRVTEFQRHGAQVVLAPGPFVAAARSPRQGDVSRLLGPSRQAGERLACRCPRVPAAASEPPGTALGSPRRGQRGTLLEDGCGNRQSRRGGLARWPRFLHPYSTCARDVARHGMLVPRAAGGTLGRRHHALQRCPHGVGMCQTCQYA